MATVTGFTSARMLAIESATVVDAAVVGDDLILTNFGGTDINAGNVRGPQGATGPMGPSTNPVGTFLMGGWASDPTGAYILDGRTIVGGATAHSVLAGIYPHWVSGSDLILPNAIGAVPMATASTGGVVSGSMTHTLTIAQLPSHTHTGPSHTHTGPSHTHDSLTHNHEVYAHTHGFSAYTDVQNHAHTYYRSDRDTSRVVHDYATGPYPSVHNLLSATSEHAHQHYLSGTTAAGGNGVTSNGGTGPTGASGTGLTGASGTGATGSTGSGDAIDHTPKNLSVKYAVVY